MNELEDFDELEVEEEEENENEMCGEDELAEDEQEMEEELEVDEEKESSTAHLLSSHQQLLNSLNSSTANHHHNNHNHHHNHHHHLQHQLSQQQQLLQHQQPVLIRNLRPQTLQAAAAAAAAANNLHSRSASAASSQSGNELPTRSAPGTGAGSPPIQDPLQIAQQAATAMAAAMAAQQLLASAAAICGIDLATLSSIAMLAGQQQAASAAPTANQQQQQQVSAASLLNGAVGLNNISSLLQSNQLPQSQLQQPPAAAQFTEQLVSAVAEVAAFRSQPTQNHHLVPEDLTVHQPAATQAHPHHQHHQPSNQHNQNHHRSQQQQQHRLQQLQQQVASSAGLVSQSGQHQNHSHNQSSNQNSNQNSNSNQNNHRHHHLLGGHHHHSSIQTQQQLLATQGFNPMAVVVGSGQQTEILTPTHLRKAKLMFFYVRYPNSSTLKECFRDVRFNKNNTAQLVKWFSNFREFYYIQMEKFARDAVADDRIQCKEDIVVNYDHELINQLNNHYNKNRHIELPEVFRQVVEETLRHFFDAIHHKRDQEQSWKKAIYKLIARLDQEVPEVFKTDAFNEHLE